MLKKAPFIFGKIASGVDFTDRVEETTRLCNNLNNGINTVLISPRRWGKSSLVAKAAKMMQKDRRIVFCFIDLFNVRTEQEFYEMYAREIIRVSATKWEDRIEQAKKFFHRIVPRFSVGLDPNSEFSVSLDLKEVKRAPEEILNLAETVAKSKKIKLVVCLDEFQNIAYFKDHLALQKKLRAHWQHHKHTTYCLYGSKRHSLMHLFSSPSMPFYKFGDTIFLEKIKTSFWIPFIRSRFRQSGKAISNEACESIATLMEEHPYFVQQLAQATWNNTAKNAGVAEVGKSLDQLLLQHGILFQREVDQLTNPQLNFLKAMCDGVEQFSSKENITHYQLGTSANVNRIKTALENKEIIDLYNSSISFIDPLFRHWLQKVYFTNR